MAEAFLIDTELTRDAVYAGIWTRLCCEMRGPDDGDQLHEYIERLAVNRGESPPLLAYLDADIDWLTAARRQLRAVEATPIGSSVELDDIERFMPVACKSEPNKAQRWIYTESETEEAELLAPQTIIRVRRGAGRDA